MNFSKHYFAEPIDEKLTDVVKDVATAGVGTAAKAAAKGLGRGIANIARGMTGRTQTIAFEPNWLKIMKPVPLATYKDLISKYANWKNQKTKLGPKKNFTIIDNKDGRLGEFSKDKFTEIIGRFDKDLQQKLDSLGDVKNLQNAKEIPIPMRMHVYIYNNKGKAIFLDMPISEDGKKRAYAIGLDNKAERAFRQVHGMPFQDYELVTGKAGEEGEEKKTAAQQGILKHKYEVPADQYKKLIPKAGAQLALAASYEYPNLLDLFEKEVLDEAKKKDYLKVADPDTKELKTAIFYNAKDRAWHPINKSEKEGEAKGYNWEGKLDDTFIKVIKRENKWVPDEDQEVLKQQIQKNKESDEGKKKEDTPEQGLLFKDIKDELDTEKPPTKVKPSEKTKNGWRFILKNGGIIFIYQTTDDKNMIGFDDKAKKVVDAKDLINKYKLEVSKETPEVEAPE